MAKRLKKHLASLPLAEPSHRGMDGEVVDGEVVEDYGPFATPHAEQHGADATAIKLEEPQS
jgi:hypothetical protein